jgi:hypothetical protein
LAHGELKNELEWTTRFYAGEVLLVWKVLAVVEQTRQAVGKVKHRVVMLAELTSLMVVRPLQRMMCCRWWSKQG